MTSPLVPKSSSSIGVGRTSVVWWIAVSSFLFLSLTAFIGSVGAYLFSGLWILVGIFALPITVRALFFRWQIWAFPTFALISTMWSTTPALTIRYSLELMITIGAALLVAEHLPPRKMITAISSSFFLVAACSVMFGRWGYDALSQSPVFMGVFASKNELAGFTNQMLLANLAIAFDPKHKFIIRLFNIFSTFFSIYLIVVTRSASSWVLGVIGPCVLFLNIAMQSKPNVRIIVIVTSIFFLLIMTFIFFAVDLDEITSVMLGVLGKNTTLTGRTDLWERALSLIPQRPLLGIGYGAFWQPNYVEAESIWRMFHMPNPYGFHFHNTYLETAIELGTIGCIILVYFIVIATVNLIRWSWSERSLVASFYVATLLVFIVRSFVEVEITSQYYIGTVLYYICMYYGYRYGERVQPTV